MKPRSRRIPSIITAAVLLLVALSVGMREAFSVAAAPSAQAVPDIRRIKNIHPTSSSNIHNLAPLCCGILTYFAANDGTTGTELWKTDGTEAGTELVKDINPSGSSLPSKTVGSSTAFFSADDGTNGIELWRTDGTAAGTVLDIDISPGASSSSPMELVEDGATLYFTADDGANGRELWKRSSGNFFLADIQPGALGSGPFGLTLVGSTLFFAADDGSNGVELWSTDGSTSGTTLIASMVKDINAGGPSALDQDHLIELGNTLLFRANDGTDGVELWKSDGTAGSTVMVKDIKPGAASSFLGGMIIAGSMIYFSADDGTTGRELWKSDGTGPGTILVKDVRPGSGASAPSRLAYINGTLLFRASDGVHGFEPWASDGTAGGTFMIKDVAVGTAWSDPALFIDGGDAAPVFFAARDDPSGREWWRTDLTEAGTELFFDLNPASGSSHPDHAVVAPSGDIIFAAQVPGSDEDRELYGFSTAQTGGLMVTKTHNKPSGVAVDTFVTYQVTIKNLGNATATDLAVLDVHSGPAVPRLFSKSIGASGHVKVSRPSTSSLFAGLFFSAHTQRADISTLPAGETLILQTRYWMPEPGTYTNTASIEGEEGTASESVTVKKKKAFKSSVNANPPAGTVINTDRITGGTINGPHAGCLLPHMHGSITIDGNGPFSDPFPAGCGWGPAFGLATFDADDDVLVVPGLTGHPNDITVYPCGGFVCVDASGVTLSANPASPDFETSMAGATIADTTSFLFGGGSGDDVLTVGGFPAPTGSISRFVSSGGGNDTVTCTDPLGCAMSGDDGNDSLFGGTGPDAFFGGGGDDTANGMGGDDTYVFGPASSAETDTLVEGAAGGSDTFDFSGLPVADPVTVDLTNDVGIATHANRTINTGGLGQAAFFENLLGGAGDDLLTVGFTEQARVIDGNLGTDSLTVDAGGGHANHSPGEPGSGTIKGPGGTITYVNIEIVVLTNLAPPPPIPSMSQWALMLLTLLFAGLIFLRLGGVGAVRFRLQADAHLTAEKTAIDAGSLDSGRRR